MKDILNGFNSENEENDEYKHSNINPLAINPNHYGIMQIIYILYSKGILINQRICPVCGKNMKEEKKTSIWMNISNIVGLKILRMTLNVI